ncbi:MAG: 50S ribosomal protein L17 [Deltaproteobacteria bacterium]|nr:50S ribosomal protein L17 [Deltaproteobacteria bacterium]
MRHLKAFRKLNRTSSHRSLMLRNLVTSLLEHERVETTVMKAKEARRIADKMITLGKKGSLHARRRAAAVLMNKTVVQRLFDEIAPRYEKREGGYTRILRVGYRKGDGAPMAFLELVKEEVKEKKKKTGKKSAKKTAVKSAPKETSAKTEKKPVSKKAAAAEIPEETPDKAAEPEVSEAAREEAEDSSNAGKSGKEEKAGD